MNPGTSLLELERGTAEESEEAYEAYQQSGGATPPEPSTATGQAAAVTTVAPTATEEIDAVVQTLVESAEGAIKTGASSAVNVLEGFLAAPVMILTDPLALNPSENKRLAEVDARTQAGPTAEAPHKKGARPSTEQEHDKGQARREERSRGREG